MSVRIIVIAIIVLIWQVSAASAQTASCNFSNTGVDFGSVNLTDAVADVATGTFSGTCTGTSGSNLRICVDFGVGDGGGTGSSSVSPRFMKQGVNNLSYNLFKDSGYTSIWGSVDFSGGLGAENIALALNGSSQPITRTIYGRIPTGQAALPSGLYQSNFSGTDARVRYDISTANCNSGLSGATTVFVPFTVKANSGKLCTVSATNLNFGAYGDLTDSAKSTTNSITVNCTSGTAYEISLNDGLYSTAAMARRMRHSATATEFVSYNIYKPASTTAWGSTGTDRLTGTGTGAAVNFTAVGNVPVQTTPIPGDYSDTVVVTVNY